MSRVSLLGVALALVACGPDWDGLDPSLGHGGAGASSSSSLSGTGAGATSSASGGCSADDMNECTEDTCTDGSPTHTPSPEGSPCTDGGTVCNGSGKCVGCNTVADCNVHCKKANQCKKNVCFQLGNAPPGTGCDENGGHVCNGSGTCVECVTNADCTAPATCGGGGTPNVCGCASAATCQTLGLTCGTANDGCGNSLDCNNGVKDPTETDIDCGGGDSCTTKCGQGDTCLVTADCQAGTCADGRCCAMPCTAQCQACNVSGSEGTCTNIPKLGTDTTGTTCSGTMACDGAGACKKANGEICSAGTDCASGTCSGTPAKCN